MLHREFYNALGGGTLEKRLGNTGLDDRLPRTTAHLELKSFARGGNAVSYLRLEN